METYIAIALSLIAVILCIVILSKVSKILDNLHTPIVKKLTPDMNLKPNSRRPVGAQEMAQRGEQHKDNRNKDRQNNKENRGDKREAQNRDRNEQRPDRGPRRERRDGRPDRPRREFNAEAPASAESTAAAPAQETPAPEARRPLAPRIPVETPAAPVAEAPVTAPAVEAPVAAPAAEVSENTFDPSKVRYGRRNVIKKAPELSDEA